jgi:hypothetical protein
MYNGGRARQYSSILKNSIFSVIIGKLRWLSINTIAYNISTIYGRQIKRQQTNG